MNKKKPYEELIIDYLNFLQISINEILFIRKIYPEIVFETRNVFGVSV